MSEQKEDVIKDAVFEAFETALESQLRSIRRLRQPLQPESSPPDKGMTNISMAYDILIKVGKPLHISELLEQIQHTQGVKIERESLVSALTKKVKRQDSFIKTGKNTFAAR